MTSQTKLDQDTRSQTEISIRFRLWLKNDRNFKRIRICRQPGGFVLDQSDNRAKENTKTMQDGSEEFCLHRLGPGPWDSMSIFSTTTDSLDRFYGSVSETDCTLAFPGDSH